MQFIKSKSRIFQIFLSALLVTVVVLGTLPLTVASAAEAPKAWFENAITHETTGLRSSSLLKVCTSGFAKEAKLKYTYTSDIPYSYNNNALAVFSSSNMATCSVTYDVKTLSDRSECYFGITSKYKSSTPLTQSQLNGKYIKVVVKDTNSKSSTYNQTAEFTYTDFLADDLSADIGTGSYGVFIDEEVHLRQLLGIGGVTHITCSNCDEKNCTVLEKCDHFELTDGAVSVRKSSSKYYIKGLKQGLAAINVKVSKNGSCLFHTTQTGEAIIKVRVFPKPTVSVKGAYFLTLTTLDPDCDYYIEIDGEYVKGTKSGDGKTVTFKGLTPETNYNILVDGKYYDDQGKEYHAYHDTEAKTGSLVTCKIGLKLDNSYVNASAISGTEGLWFIDESKNATQGTKSSGSNRYNATLDLGTYKIVLGNSDSTFTVDTINLTGSYTKDYKFFTVTYNKPTTDGTLPADQEKNILPESTKIKIDPNGGSYKGSTATQIVTLSSTLTIEDATKSKCVFMGWEKTAGDKTNYDYVLTAVWEDDKNENKVPDKYEKTVTYKIENGKWSDKTDKDKTETVVLKKNNKWDVNGTATITLPTEMTANYGYENGSWDSTDTTIKGDTTFKYSYTKIGDQDLKYNKPTPDGTLPTVPTEEKLPYGTKVKIDPNGGSYKGSTATTIVPLESALTIADPTKSKCLFMGWEKTAGDKTNYDYVLTAVWEDDKNDDNIPDKYQKTVTYKVVYGTWSDKSVVDKTELVTLKTAGKWDVNGSATITKPTNMIANYGYEKGSWDKSATTVTKAETFTYTFDKIADQDLKYNKPTPDGTLPTVPTEEKLPYGTKVKIDPNGGSYKGSTATTIVPLESALTIADPTKSKCLFMGWKKTVGDKTNYDYVLTAVWEDDKNDDNIPDKYQKTVTYKIVYGAWNDLSVLDKTELVTLKTAGKWDVNGSAVITKPTNMIANYGYEKGFWDKSATTVTKAETFTYTFDKIPDQKLKYNKPKDNGNLPNDPFEEELPYGTKLTIDPNGGLYEGSPDKVEMKLEKETEIKDPVREKYLFMGWEKTTTPDGVTLKAIWELDDNGDGIPDKFQKTVTFNINNGTWSNKDNGKITLVVTLMKDGIWSVDGTAEVEFPEGMLPADGYEKGAWNNTKLVVTADMNDVEYNYTFTEIPKTGDAFSLIAMAIATFISAVAALFLFRKKVA